jgi:hypothetical protein
LLLVKDVVGLYSAPSYPVSETTGATDWLLILGYRLIKGFFFQKGGFTR